MNEYLNDKLTLAGIDVRLAGQIINMMGNILW
jgi:hypothetical protein